MRKVSFSLLVFGVVGVVACVTVPRTAWAAGGDGQVGNEAPVLHPHKHRVAKRAGARRAAEKKIAAAPMTHAPMRELAVLANEAATQPDIAPVPPPMRRLEKAGAAATKAGEKRRLSESKAASEAAAAKRKAAEQAPLPREVRQFCASTAGAAADARVAWQATRLTELATKLRQRIAELEVKRAEYEDWLHKHDDAMKEATGTIVAIYSRMRPDAAAAQLSVMDDVMAASLLAKLNSRVASAILAEMDPSRAARITNAMVGPPSPAGGKKS